MGKRNENHTKVKFEAEKGAEPKQVKEMTAVKEKIKDPNYLNSAVIGATADRILESLGF